MNQREWIVIGLALATPGLAFWLAPGPPLAGRAGAAAESAWVLPALPAADSALLAYQRLQARQPTGAAGETVADDGAKAGDAAEPLAEGDWRLRGVVQTGGQRYALIETAAGKTRRYREGEVLPRGEKLRAVRRDHIEISAQEATAIRVLYRSKAGVAPP